MRVRRTAVTGWMVAAAALLWTGGLSAQTGTIMGRVTNGETGQPVNQAQIQFLGASSTGSLSDGDGRYRAQLTAGTYDIVVTVIGYRETRFDNVGVSAGQTTTFDIRLVSQAQELDGLVITASRGRAEKATEAPATIDVVSSVEIAERPAPSLTEHLRASPGVDIITQGIQSTNIVVRGFNNIFSGSLHMLTDHRLAGVPSLRVNLMHFLPTTDEDVDRMEVVLGPGSALYGPNTANGVVHILTKSPLDHQGTTVSLGAGQRDFVQGIFRTAHLISPNLGVKLSGQYVTGDEWEYVDPTEEAARAAADASPQACIQDKVIRGLDAGTAQLACGRIGIRDFDTRRWTMEARGDWRFADDGTAVLTYGRTDATGIELTGLGAGQTENWIYEAFQARLNKGRFFTQAYLNSSDAGDSYLLASGLPLVDQSKLWVAQIQHGFETWEGRQDFTYGVDYFATRPDTRGTINGFYEDRDDIDEVGAYLQSKTELTDQLELILAGRVDHHSLLDHEVWSPRAGLVYKPTETQSFRATYNRAFSTPSSLNFFLDISGGAAPVPLGPLGYTTRAFGTGPDGYSFQNADGSLRGIRSPFNPGGAGQLLPADAGVLYKLALGVLSAQGAIDAQTAALLNSLNPTNADIGLMLLNTNTGDLSPLSATTIADVPGIEESNTETFEVGWTGILDNRVKLTADAYYLKKNNFVSPLLVQTPLVLLNGQDVGAYLTVPVVTAITQQLIAAGLDPATAQAQAQAQAAVLIPQLAGGIAQIPLGVVSSDQVNAQGADLIATYRNVGDINLWGADFAFQAFLTDRWSLTGTYSHVSEDFFEIDDGTPIALNAPRHKGTVGFAFRDVTMGFNADARVRFNSEFPAQSAGFVGTRCIEDTGGAFQEDCVDSSAIVDMNLGYKVPNTAATLQLGITNLFDADYRSFVGVPNIGRFAILRVKYDFF